MYDMGWGPPHATHFGCMLAGGGCCALHSIWELAVTCGMHASTAAAGRFSLARPCEMAEEVTVIALQGLVGKFDCQQQVALVCDVISNAVIGGLCICEV